MNVFYKGASRYLDFSNPSHVSATIVSTARAYLKGVLLTAIFLSVGVSAQTISPQMMQQLQSMPRAQQEALAKQYGIDLDQVLGGAGAKGANADIAMPGEPLEQRTLLDTDLESQLNYQLFQKKFAEFEKSLIEEKEELKRYGVSLFDKEVSTFAPTDDASVPDNYRLGAGDQLSVQLFGTEDQQYNLQITRDGQVSFPKLGPIAVAGLTYEDARDLIQSRVKDQIIGAQATLSMGRLRAINIFMAGEVTVPGAYSVSALTTITQALFQAGGIGDIGALRNIQVKRNGVVAETFDLYQLLLKGDASGDIRLQSGDVVFVPPYAGIVEVEGAVKRPMIYEFIDGESVADAVSMAGGLNQDAYSAAIAVVSKAVGKFLPGAANIDLNQADRTTIGLRNGDRIRVPESTDNLENAVTLEGAVVRPGVYGWIAGQRISDIISSIPGDLKPYADLDYGLVVRQKNVQRDIEVFQINLVKALNDVGSQDNILTQARDKIMVFGLPSVTEISALDMANNQLERLEVRLKKMQASNRYASANYSAGTSELTADDKTGTDTGTGTGTGTGTRAGIGTSTSTSIDTSTGSNTAVGTKAEAEAEAALKAVERLVLLKPVLEKLKGQARSGEPLGIVSISGAVKLPGDYPLGSKDTVANLVAAAGGLKDSAFLDSAELGSLYLGPNKNILSRYRDLNLRAELASLSRTKLQSRDHLNVKELPDWNPTNEVTLEGEVRFPGTYRIRKNERLYDVIERAGGLTQSSFPVGAIFTRESIAELEDKRSKQFAQSILRDFASSQLTKEDNNIKIGEVQAIAAILENFEGAGRLLVDVEAAMSGDSLANIVLEDGDTLKIPERISTVTVVGEIRRPGTHTFHAGLDLNDYLGLSAGLTARAESKELYIVRADGSVLRPTTSWLRFTGGNDSISPGDTIVVPIDAGYTDNLTLWREVTQVVFNTTSGLASMVLVTR
jgi:polysaccharide export outer membrane protein